MMYKIRDMEYSDLDWVVVLAAPSTFEKEMKRPDLYHPQQLEKIFNHILVNGISYSCYQGDRCVGVIGGVNHPHIFNPDIQVCTSVFWFVDPEYRNSKVASLLFRAYNKEIVRQGRESILGIQLYSNMNDKVFQKLGYEPTEKIYTKRN